MSFSRSADRRDSERAETPGLAPSARKIRRSAHDDTGSAEAHNEVSDPRHAKARPMPSGKGGSRTL
jgi:hypothetical protein